MKLTAPQRHALEVVALRKHRLDDDRRAAEYAIRAEVAERTRLTRSEYERAVVDADLLGVPKAQIAYAIGTTNPKPIREIIRRAETMRRSTQSARFARGDRADQLVVRLEGEDLAKACSATGWPVQEAVAAGADRAVFAVRLTTLVAETASFVQDAGRLHPVVYAVRNGGSVEALAWWEEQS